MLELLRFHSILFFSSRVVAAVTRPTEPGWVGGGQRWEEEEGNLCHETEAGEIKGGGGPLFLSPNQKNSDRQSLVLLLITELYCWKQLVVEAMCTVLLTMQFLARK